VTIFSGLFFHSDFHKHFSGRTFVVPDRSEQLLGRWARKLQNLSRNEPLIEMENTDFERAFAVHSTDPIEARYILTPIFIFHLLIQGFSVRLVLMKNFLNREFSNRVFAMETLPKCMTL